MSLCGETFLRNCCFSTILSVPKIRVLSKVSHFSKRHELTPSTYSSLTFLYFRYLFSGQPVIQNINFQQLQRQLPNLGGMKDGQTLNIVQPSGAGSLNIQPMGGQTQIIHPIGNLQQITAGQLIHPQLIQPIGAGQINFQQIGSGQGLLAVQPVTMITAPVNPPAGQVFH